MTQGDGHTESAATSPSHYLLPPLSCHLCGLAKTKLKFSMLILWLNWGPNTQSLQIKRIRSLIPDNFNFNNSNTGHENFIKLSVSLLHFSPNCFKVSELAYKQFSWIKEQPNHIHRPHVLFIKKNALSWALCAYDENLQGRNWTSCFHPRVTNDNLSPALNLRKIKCPRGRWSFPCLPSASTKARARGTGFVKRSHSSQHVIGTQQTSWSLAGIWRSLPPQHISWIIEQMSYQYKMAYLQNCTLFCIT